jgi:hypothetical protein
MAARRCRRCSTKDNISFRESASEGQNWGRTLTVDRLCLSIPYYATLLVSLDFSFLAA